MCFQVREAFNTPLALVPFANSILIIPIKIILLHSVVV